MSSDGIDVWYRNELTGGVFGFSLPLHPGVAAQVDAKNLVRCPPPGDGLNPDDEMLNVCSDCGSTAAQDADGGWLDQCAGCAKKRAAAARKPTK